MKKKFEKDIKSAYDKFKVIPPDSVWNNIENALNQKKIVRKKKFQYSKYAAVLAFLLLSCWLTLSHFSDANPFGKLTDFWKINSSQSDKNLTKIAENKNQSNKEKQKNNAQNPIKKTMEKVNPQDSISIKENYLSRSSSTQKNNHSTHSTQNNKLIKEEFFADNFQKLLDKNKKIQEKHKLSDIEKQRQNLKTIARNPTKENLQITKFFPGIVADLKENIANISPKDNAFALPSKNFIWEISTYASPVYSINNKKNQSWTSDLNNYDVKNDFTSLLGFRAGINITKNLKISTGVEYFSLSQSANNVNLTINKAIASQFSPEGIGNNDIAYKQNLFIDNIKIEKQSLESFVANDSRLNGKVTQKVSYIGIPIQLQYKFYSSSWADFNVSGGLNTYFLSNNEVSFQNGEAKQNIGELKEARSAVLIPQIGINFDFNTFKKTKIFIEPNVMYFNNMFNNNANPKIFTFGINGGIKIEL